MVQVQIHLQYNFDLKAAEMVPATYRGSIVLCTEHGENTKLHDIQGIGGAEDAQEAAFEWVNRNLLDARNQNCRQIRYLHAAEN